MSRFLLFALLALAVATTARAQVPSGDAGASVAASEDGTIRYKVVVDGPNPVADALRAGLDLIRWQVDEEMTLDLLRRLVREALPRAREIAAIHGYYDAKIDAKIERDGQPYVVRLKVDPGAPVKVTSVDLDVSGPATKAPRGEQVIAAARDGWSLRLGEVFRQSEWNDAKARALGTIRRSPYAAAKIVKSEARVTPDQHAADLALNIESGPPFAIGDVEVQGTQRYSPQLLRNFSTLKRGEPYEPEAIDAYVRRLAASGYFASVQASIDTEAADPDDATVKVAVIEAPTHRVEAAISYSTDTEYGARVRYTNINLDGKALQMRAEVRVEALLQRTEVAFTWPPTPSGWIDTLTVTAQRSDLQNTVETTGAFGVERRGLDERGHPVFGAAVYYDRMEPVNARTTEAHATYLEAGYVIRRVDDLLAPSRGYMADVRAGIGVPGVSTEGFGRLIARTAAWYPINRLTNLAFRAEMGAVLGAERENVPSALRFRTGGDTTVRGYEYLSLGVPVGDGIVGGRYYALASAELIRWINETWGVAAFVDAGNAVDRIEDFDVAVGYGLGARLRTPIGPFRLDVAYGEKTKKIRLHFSVGLTF